jgi:hypothetical protein
MNNLHVLNLSAYTTPTIQESKRDNWVEFGEDNNYYSFLVDRYTNSTTNNAIINNISKLVYGRGLTAIDSNKKPNEWAQFMTIFDSECVRKMVLDRKMLGQFAIQVHYSKDRKKILKAYHMPVNLLRAEKCNKDGEIEGYYYSDNWLDVKKFAPKRIPAFGFSNEQIEILFCKPYSVGMKYYAYPDYQGCLPYCVLEEEVSDYLINEVQNGFSGTKVVNFNNGLPSEEQQEIITSKVLSKLTGSRGQKVIVAFNQNQESKTTVDDLPLNDAPEHYSYLSEECLRKIMLGHNVTSPLLFGIASSNGFSSNSDELRNSTILYENMVIKPIQDQITQAFDTILAYNGIKLKLQFSKLNPLDAAGEITMEGVNKQLIDSINNLSPLVANKVIETLTPNEIRGIVGLKPESGGSDLDPQLLSKINTDLEEILAEVDANQLGEGWVMVDERETSESDEELDLQLIKAETDLEPKTTLLSRLINLVQTGNPLPKLKSVQDKKVGDLKYFKVRYKYTGNKTPERPFCKAMMAKEDRLFRKEDIDAMSKRAVNAGWGEFGANTYDIFKYKGGARCHHKWSRVTFMLDLNAIEKGYEEIGTRKAEIKGYKVTNPYEVSIYPNNLPLKGFSPNNPNTGGRMLKENEE